MNKKIIMLLAAGVMLGLKAGDRLSDRSLSMRELPADAIVPLIDEADAEQHDQDKAAIAELLKQKGYNCNKERLSMAALNQIKAIVANSSLSAQELEEPARVLTAIQEETPKLSLQCAVASLSCFFGTGVFYFITEEDLLSHFALDRACEVISGGLGVGGIIFGGAAARGIYRWYLAKKAMQSIHGRASNA